MRLMVLKKISQKDNSRNEFTAEIYQTIKEELAPTYLKLLCNVFKKSVIKCILPSNITVMNKTQ